MNPLKWSGPTLVFVGVGLFLLGTAIRIAARIWNF